MQRYTHPTQIPRSRTIRCIDWLSDLIRIKNPNILGDSHPMTWAADDAIYIGTGDPLYYVKDGVPTRAVVDVPSPPDRSSEAWDLYCRTTGTVFERITGDPEDMQLARINDLTYFNGYGGSGVKPTGMLSVNGTLFFAVQNLLGCKVFRGNSLSAGQPQVLTMGIAVRSGKLPPMSARPSAAGCLCSPATASGLLPLSSLEKITAMR